MGKHADTAGEHNLPLVLSNLHFPWCLREVDVSSCFLIIRLRTQGYTHLFLTGKEEMALFLLLASLLTLNNTAFVVRAVIKLSRRACISALVLCFRNVSYRHFFIFKVPAD